MDRRHADFHLQTQKLKPPKPVSIMIMGVCGQVGMKPRHKRPTQYLLSKISYLQFDPVLVERTSCTKSRVR